MTRRDREIAELAEWAATYDVRERGDLLMALDSARIEPEDVDDLECERDTILAREKP